VWWVSDPVFDPEEDALDAYWAARERSRKLRAEWEVLGSPATALGGSTGKVLTEHPLLSAMRMAEGHEAKLREVVRRKYRGPDPRVVLGGLPVSSQRTWLRAAAQNGEEVDLARRDWRKCGA
jgi:hypothetical protein